AAQHQHEQAEEARHDVAVLAIGTQQAERELGCDQQREPSDDEVRGEVDERQSLHLSKSSIRTGDLKGSTRGGACRYGEYPVRKVPFWRGLTTSATLHTRAGQSTVGGCPA